MGKWVIGMTSAFLLLLPQVGWGQGEHPRVGVRTLGNLEIALYAWGPQEIAHHREEDHDKEDDHHKPGGRAAEDVLKHMGQSCPMSCDCPSGKS